MILERLEHYAIGSFDLAVTAWVGDRGIVDVDEVVLQKSYKTELVKAAPRSVMILFGHTEAMFDVSDEFDCFF
jgi:hypothetical protein